MTIILLNLSSHILFTYIAYHLLTTVVDWAKFTKIYPENQGRLRLLVLFISLALGYFVSSFFLELMEMGRSLASNF